MSLSAIQRFSRRWAGKVAATLGILVAIMLIAGAFRYFWFLPWFRALVFMFVLYWVIMYAEHHSCRAKHGLKDVPVTIIGVLSVIGLFQALLAAIHSTMR